MKYQSNLHRTTEPDDLTLAKLCAHGRARINLRLVRNLGLSLGLLLLLSCNPKTATVLEASFNSDQVGSPPNPKQTVGTLSIFGSPKSVVVVDAPAPGTPTTKWLRITEMRVRGDFDAGFGGEGNYGLLASLYIPSGTGIVTLRFEPDFNPESGNNFLHIDFMPQGDLRIDDSNIRFGQFPRDKPFTISVKLQINSVSGSAEIKLFGTGASGDQTVNIQPSLFAAARRFSAISFLMGVQEHGTFFVDDTIVTRTP